MYYQLYEILSNFIYGDVALTQYQDLTLTLFSTFVCFACIGFPFLVTAWLIKFLWRLFSGH